MLRPYVVYYPMFCCVIYALTEFSVTHNCYYICHSGIYFKILLTCETYNVIVPTMGNLIYGIISLIFLSSCVLSSSLKEPIRTSEKEPVDDYLSLSVRDSITVDTVVGDYKVFYRVSELIDEGVELDNRGKASVGDSHAKNKIVLLNIQHLDTTSVVAFKTIEVLDFECVVPNANDDGYSIESFCLKEVRQNFLVFGVKLCKFDKDFCKNVELFVDKSGRFNYIIGK